MGTAFTAAEAIGAGQTYWQLSAAVRRRQLGRPWRGIYLTNLSAGWLEQLTAAVHAAGGVVSHRAAARLHGLWGFESDVVELTLPPGRRFFRPGVHAHQACLLVLQPLARLREELLPRRHPIQWVEGDQHAMPVGAVQRQLPAATISFSGKVPSYSGAPVARRPSSFSKGLSICGI